MSAVGLAEVVSTDVVDGPYRYRLSRVWDESLPTACFRSAGRDGGVDD